MTSTQESLRDFSTVEAMPKELRTEDLSEDGREEPFDKRSA